MSVFLTTVWCFYYYVGWRGKGLGLTKMFAYYYVGWRGKGLGLTKMFAYYYAGLGGKGLGLRCLLTTM